MIQLILIPLFTVLVVIILAVVVSGLVKRGGGQSDARLNKEFLYRKDPHADQTTAHPNRLSDNDVTRG